MTTPTTNLQQSPYLREQRQFPNENLRELANQVDHAYIDIASKVNARTIGLYATSFAIVTGDSWYVSANQRQQSLRQVYSFTAAGNIPHGINFASVSQISPNSYGSYTDGTNWYGVIYSSSVGIAGQATFYVTPTNIVVAVDATAPIPTSGTIVLEWISQF
jgi:hypothetical protein